MHKMRIALLLCVFLVVPFVALPASLIVGCSPEPCDIQLSTIPIVPIDPPVIDPPVIDPPVIDPPPAGTLISRDFTTQAEIDDFHWVSSMVYGPGDIRAGRYDAAIGGAILPITPGESLPALRDDRESVEAPLTGRVFVEYEIYIPQAFYDLPWGTQDWDTMKTLRVFNNGKRLTTQDTAATMTYVSGSQQFWVRSLGDIDDLMSNDDNFRLGWQPIADTWTKIRLVWDYDQNMFEVSAPGLSKSVGVQGLKPVDNVAPLLHSTSRSHGDSSGDVAGAFIGYRHVRMGVE